MFADEAGNFDFSRKKGASRYFILTTVTMDDCRTGDALAHLRRSLTWEGINLPQPFHATDDTPAVRDAVFDLLMRSPIRIDATVLEKRKAESHLQGELARRVFLVPRLAASSATRSAMSSSRSHLHVTGSLSGLPTAIRVFRLPTTVVGRSSEPGSEKIRPSWIS